MAPINDSNKQPSFFKLVLICLLSACFDSTTHSCNPISYAIFPMDSFLTSAIFFSVIKPSFSFGNLLYK